MTWRLATLAMHVAALIPLALVLWKRWTDPFWINPVEDMSITTGKTALNLLMLCLACTPIQRWLGFNKILLWRRPLGLYAFGYALLHFWIFVALDYRLSLPMILADVSSKRYIYYGLAALALLVPLAVTSDKAWMARLRKNWKRLHRLVYLAAILAVLHFLALSKTWFQPAQYAVVLAVLLILRLIPRRRAARAVARPEPTAGL
jgi:sulfoxide reductase heme-binding subunit YedZ